MQQDTVQPAARSLGPCSSSRQPPCHCAEQLCEPQGTGVLPATLCCQEGRQEQSG